MAHRRRRKNPDLNEELEPLFKRQLDSILEKMQKLSDAAGRLATHAPSQYPWIRTYLQEIADKTDDLGERFEEELETEGLI